MKKLLLVLDDESVHLLEGKVNKSAFIRESIKYMSMYITTDTLKGMRESYAQLLKLSKEIDSKIDYIAKKLTELHPE